MPQKTYMYDTQWNQLINAIGAGDSSAVVTALNTIKNSLDNITNAISNQTITLDLSNINSDNVSNLSNITGSNLSTVLNLLNDRTQFNSFSIPFKGDNINFIKIANVVVCLCAFNNQVSLVYNTWAYAGAIPLNFPRFRFLTIPLVNGQSFVLRCAPGGTNMEYIYSGSAGNVWLQGSGSTIIS